MPPPFFSARLLVLCSEGARRLATRSRPEAEPPTVPPCCILPCSRLACVREVDITVPWNANLSECAFIGGTSESESDRDVTIPGLVTKLVRCSISWTIPQDNLFLLILSVAEFDMDRDATVCYARVCECWSPNTPILCKLINRIKGAPVVSQGKLLARVVTVNTQDS